MRHNVILEPSGEGVALSCSCGAWIELPARCSLELAADILREHERDVDVANKRARRAVAEQYRRAVDVTTDQPPD